MTKAKAATVAAALVNGGYFPIVELRQDGEYTVTANEASLGVGIPLSDGAAFQTAQGIASAKSPTMIFV